MAFDLARSVRTILARVKSSASVSPPNAQSVTPDETARQIMFYWQQFLKDQPMAFYDIVRRCRYYAINSAFISLFLSTKISLYNYGLSMVADSGTPGDQASLDAWLKQEMPPIVDVVVDVGTREEIDIEPNCTWGEQLRKLSHDSWREWFTMDNLAALWLDNRRLATLLPIERCLYSDIMGLEAMRYQHNLSTLQIEQLPPEQQLRFRNQPAVFINPKFGEHYKLIKKTPTGDGFAFPGMLSIFMILGEVESKKVGFHAMAWLLRKVTRHHKLGHEIKQGPNAGKAWHFWKNERAIGVKSAYQDVTGIDDYTGNFDHDISFPWPDLKQFDGTAFKGSNEQLKNWSGAIGQMILTDKVNTTYASLLRADAKLERETYIGPFLNMVYNKAFKPPVPFHVEWSSTIFMEDRLQSELIKFGVIQGGISSTSMVEAAGLDPKKEEARKLVIANDVDAEKKFTPAWDSSHGTAPALDGTMAVIEANNKAKAAKGAAAGSKTGGPTGTPHSS